MAKLFFSILFSLFLLFQTTAAAEEENIPTETNVEEQEAQPEAEKAVEPEEESKEEISEAEKEAQAAEEAELREAGAGEEPLPE